MPNRKIKKQKFFAFFECFVGLCPNHDFQEFSWDARFHLPAICRVICPTECFESSNHTPAHCLSTNTTNKDNSRNLCKNVYFAKKRRQLSFFENCLLYSIKDPATSYFPGRSPSKYCHRYQSLLSCSGWERVVSWRFVTGNLFSRLGFRFRRNLGQLPSSRLPAVRWKLHRITFNHLRFS